LSRFAGVSGAGAGVPNAPHLRVGVRARRRNPERSEGSAEIPNAEGGRDPYPLLWPSACFPGLPSCRQFTQLPYFHPAFFQLLLQTKHFRKSTLGSLLRDAWVALGSRWVTQSQTQSQASAEGRRVRKPHGAKPESPTNPLLAWRGGKPPRNKL
jgi:hypothetical protein